MYLSSLLIDAGENPDRPRPGRHWLRNRYHVHQRLCMAFPSPSRKGADADFLEPFNPAGFGRPGDDGLQQIHVERCPDAGFLFRIDPQPRGRVVIVVQSALEPDWDYAFHNAPHLLAACPEVKKFTPVFQKDQPLRFRLLANPTRKVDTKSGPGGERRNGKRLPVADDKLCDWLEGKGQAAGFQVAKDSLAIQLSRVYAWKKKSGAGAQERNDAEQKEQDKTARGVTQTFFAARYDGTLSVSGPALFRAAIVHGIGPGKAYGFGLLSVAPASGV